MTTDSLLLTGSKAIATIAALPLISFVAWFLYCHVAFMNNFTARCGEELRKAQNKNALLEEIHIVDQHVRSFDRQSARLGYTYDGGRGKGNVQCEVDTVRSIKDLSPIRIWAY